jgi:4-amino-4-deoxy-L-arabinose transferase-like glycosyltransferase
VSTISANPHQQVLFARPSRLGSCARALDSHVAHSCILVMLCLGLFCYGSWGLELWRTESLRARIAQEMLAAGDWIVPRLYGEPLFTKPPGMYIAVVLCSLPFGQVNEFSA